MTIDPDVQAAAARFNLPWKLVQAVVNAEGGGMAILKAVQCSEPDVQTRADALTVVCRSLVHRLADFANQDDNRLAFVDYFASKWAPTGVQNDPTNLNANFPKNLLQLWQSA